MEFRLAEMKDLPNIKSVYARILENLTDCNLCVWDEIYPSTYFEEDITESRLYVLLDGGVITGALALCEDAAGAENMKWKDNSAKALYIYRFGVNVDYQGNGWGGKMLQKVITHAKNHGIKYLRLFVVVDNLPAIKLYANNGFYKIEGVFEERIDEKTVLREFGYERETSND